MQGAAPEVRAQAFDGAELEAANGGRAAPQDMGHLRTAEPAQTQLEDPALRLRERGKELSKLSQFQLGDGQLFGSA